MVVLSLVWLAMLAAGPDAHVADSDGYYCVGPDYLAYQFGMAYPPVAPHRLFVVRPRRRESHFGPRRSGGFGNAGTSAEMRCRTTHRRELGPATQGVI
jgi:hypothetical protein